MWLNVFLIISSEWYVDSCLCLCASWRLICPSSPKGNEKTKDFLILNVYLTGPVEACDQRKLPGGSYSFEGQDTQPDLHRVAPQASSIGASPTGRPPAQPKQIHLVLDQQGPGSAGSNLPELKTWLFQPPWGSHGSCTVFIKLSVLPPLWFYWRLSSNSCCF